MLEQKYKPSKSGPVLLAFGISDTHKPQHLGAGESLAEYLFQPLHRRVGKLKVRETIAMDEGDIAG